MEIKVSAFCWNPSFTKAKRLVRHEVTTNDCMIIMPIIMDPNNGIEHIAKVIGPNSPRRLPRRKSLK